MPTVFSDDEVALDVCNSSEYSLDDLKNSCETLSYGSCGAYHDDEDSYLHNDSDLLPLHLQSVSITQMCDEFASHAWKVRNCIVTSDYKLSRCLEGVIDVSIRNYSVFIEDGPSPDCQYNASQLHKRIHRAYKARRERKQAGKIKRLWRTCKSRKKHLQKKSRWLPTRTNRICICSQCLFISNNWRKRKQFAKNDLCIDRYVGSCKGDRTSADLDANKNTKDTDSANNEYVVRSPIKESGGEATGNTEGQRTSTEQKHSETPKPGQLDCDLVDVATPPALCEFGATNLPVDPGNILNEKQDGNAGCVSSSVEGAGQSPDGECVEFVDSEESAENDADILQGSEEVVDTNAPKNVDTQNQQCKLKNRREVVEDVSTCAKESKEHNVRSAAEASILATGGLTATCKKLNKMNKVRPGSEILHSLVSTDDMRGAIECLEQKVSQPLQAEASIVSYKKKPQDEEDKDEVSQHYSVDRVPPSSQEGIVAMMRTQRLSSPHTQRLTTVQNGFNQEIRRLATFFQSNTPDGIFVIPIAKTGFFLTSSPDDRGSSDAKVECAFCAVTVDILLFLSRIAEEVHREVSPRCPFLLGENVGNVSIAEIAEQAGAKFLDKYPLTAGCTTSASATTRSLQTATSPVRRDHLAEVLATDSEPTAAEEPASYPLSLPTDKPGSVFSSLPADIIRSSQPFGNNDSGRLRDTAGPQLHQQLQRDGTQGSGSRDVGETVADSRPALAAGTGGSHLAASASATAPSAGRTEMPYQTATFSTPEPQSSNTGTATPSQTTTANQPASNQTNGPHQTATVSAGPVTSGGTAREAPQSTAPGSEGEDRSQTSGNGGGTDSSGRSENGTERQLVTYEELGIFSQRPKRPDMAVTQVRINTFEGWPHQASHPKEEMAEAGFYYTGHADLVRCFHCKGGLKTWESSDQPWIEHSRWFPRCPFIKLCKGQKFVQAVQKLNDPDTRPTITESDVLVEIRNMEDEERSSLRADVVLLENLPNPNVPADPVDAVLARTGLRVDADVTEASMQEVAERLAEENEELTSSTLCKMCQTNEVNVLFLPCGHLVSCAQCAPALRTCAMCRQPVRGSVRVLLDEKRESQEARQQPSGGAAASTQGKA